MSSIWSKEGLHKEMGAVTFKSKTGIYKCATCQEVCAEPNALESARLESDRLLEALRDAVNWNDEYKKINNLSGDPYWVEPARKLIAKGVRQ